MASVGKSVALAGVSHWHADMHAQAALAAGATVAAVWDPSRAAAEAFAERFSCRVAQNLAALFPLADLVVVMGRPREIAERALKAVEAGVPVLVEKPIGICAADIDPLVEAAERRNAFAAVALPHGLGMGQALADLRRDDRLGPLSHSYFRLINGPPRRYLDDGVGWVLERAVGGGGALRNLGIHGVAAFLALADDRSVTIEHAAFGRPVHGTEVEDYAAVVLRAADGVLGVVEAGYTYASITRGLFEWRVAARDATLTDTGERIAVATLADGRVHDRPANPPQKRYEDMMKTTLSRMSAGRPPAVSLRDCRRAMRIVDRCYRLAEER